MPHLRSVQPRLHVADLRRAIAFYTEVLGFDIGAVFPAERPTFALLERDTVGVQLGGADVVRAAGDRSTCTLWIETDDARALHEGLAGRVTVEWGPEVYAYGRREFAIRDPDGSLVILSEATDDPVTSPDD